MIVVMIINMIIIIIMLVVVMMMMIMMMIIKINMNYYVTCQITEFECNDSLSAASHLYI